MTIALLLITAVNWTLMAVAAGIVIGTKLTEGE